MGEMADELINRVLDEDVRWDRIFGKSDHSSEGDEDEDPTFIPSHNRCNICGDKNLHWSREGGTHRLRTQQGTLHKCNRHGVVINLKL